MKKSTVLILLIVFLGSVLVVGIFGMQSVPYEQIQYVKQIVPTSVTSMSGNAQSLQIQIDDNGYYVMLPYEEGLELLINYELKPADCTNKKIKIAVVYPKNPPAELTERNTIIFNRKGAVHLQYVATDSAASAPMMDFWIYTY